VAYWISGPKRNLGGTATSLIVPVVLNEQRGRFFYLNAIKMMREEDDEDGNEAMRRTCSILVLNEVV
jgi:hypothetical protein